MFAKSASLVKAHWPFVVATIGEFVALYFWLHYYDLGQSNTATVVLWGGFLVERLAVLHWVKVNFGPDVGIGAQSKPWWRKLIGLLLICLSEIVVWVIFVQVYDHYGILAGFAVIFIGEQIEHSIELGLLARTSFVKFLFSRSALFITVLEAGAGLAWVYLVRHEQSQLGGAMLVLGLTVEHVIQGNAIKKKVSS